MNLQLREYLNEVILPKYNGLDEGHNEKHILEVWRYAKLLNKKYLDLNEDLIMTAVYYHDLGNLVNREDHHEISAQIVLNDNNLLEFFNKEEIETISEGCRNHRCSIHKEKMSVFEKLINDADTCDGIEIHRWIERSFSYTYHKLKGIKTFDEICQEVYDHSINKFGENGYSKNFLLRETKDILKEDIHFRNTIFNNKEIFLQEINFLGKKIIE